MARRRTGYSQEALAARCSLHRVEIGLLEHGRRLPRVDTFLKLMAALEARSEELLGGITWVPAPGRGGGFVVKP